MKKIVFLILAFAVCFTAFSVGFTRGQTVALQRVYAEGKTAEAEAALGQYTIYRDMVKSIKSNQLGNALCSANIGASSSFEDVKACVANVRCGQLLSAKITEVAPEIFDKTPLPFDYLKIKNGIRSCTQ